MAAQGDAAADVGGEQHHADSVAAGATGGGASVAEKLEYIKCHKLAANRPVYVTNGGNAPGAANGRPMTAGSSSGGSAGAAAKWVQPSGPRRPGEGVENEEQGIVTAESSGPGSVTLRITLLAAGFIIGPSGASVRDIMRHSGCDIKSWTEAAGRANRRPCRVFVVEGDEVALAHAMDIITAAVDRYKELCEGRCQGQAVPRQQRVMGVEFSYQPPPRNVVPFAASLKGHVSRPAKPGPGEVDPSMALMHQQQQAVAAAMASGLMHPGMLPMLPSGGTFLVPMAPPYMAAPGGGMMGGGDGSGGGGDEGYYGGVGGYGGLDPNMMTHFISLMMPPSPGGARMPGAIHYDPLTGLAMPSMPVGSPPMGTLLMPAPTPSDPSAAAGGMGGGGSGASGASLPLSDFFKPPPGGITAPGSGGRPGAPFPSGSSTSGPTGGLGSYSGDGGGGLGNGMLGMHMPGFLHGPMPSPPPNPGAPPPYMTFGGPPPLGCWYPPSPSPRQAPLPTGLISPYPSGSGNYDGPGDIHGYSMFPGGMGMGMGMMGMGMGMVPPSPTSRLNPMAQPWRAPPTGGREDMQHHHGGQQPPPQQQRGAMGSQGSRERPAARPPQEQPAPSSHQWTEHDTAAAAAAAAAAIHAVAEHASRSSARGTAPTAAAAVTGPHAVPVTHAVATPGTVAAQQVPTAAGGAAEGGSAVCATGRESPTAVLTVPADETQYTPAAAAAGYGGHMGEQQGGHGPAQHGEEEDVHSQHVMMSIGKTPKRHAALSPSSVGHSARLMMELSPNQEGTESPATSDNTPNSGLRSTGAAAGRGSGGAVESAAAGGGGGSSPPLMDTSRVMVSADDPLVSPSRFATRGRRPTATGTRTSGAAVSGKSLGSPVPMLRGHAAHAPATPHGSADSPGQLKALPNLFAQMSVVADSSSSGQRPGMALQEGDEGMHRSVSLPAHIAAVAGGAAELDGSHVAA